MKFNGDPGIYPRLIVSTIIRKNRTKREDRRGEKREEEIKREKKREE